jgi:pyruvate/2-oxoglutarate dehydrogenase complex dihydrolipoamide dehydrogenase (E3) component
MTQTAPHATPAATAAETAAALGSEPLAADICVIGAGAGGLTAATLAAAFGRKVVVVEKHRMGGSFNVGSIPSKALIASANRAHAMRHAAELGIPPVEPQIDLRAVQAHVKGAIASIAPNESIERFSGLGIRVVLGGARFLDARTILAGDYRISARRFIIATGSSPAVHAIPGLDRAPYFTNESIFENDRKISHLVVIGGGPVGLELAQAHARLGSRVTVIEAARALGRDDPEATAVLLAALRAEGIEIHEGSKAERVESLAGFARIHISTIDGPAVVDGSHVLFAAGRNPNVSDLNLEAAGIKYSRSGIVVNRGMRTSNRRVYAIGDVTGGPAFSHVSTYQAEVVMRRALFWLPAKVDPALIPWVTYTDPELAHVGLSESEARAARYRINVLRWPFSENDRAIAERRTVGHIKVVTTQSGRILGATIVGPQAGELIQMWALAVAQRLDIKALTGYVAPYPTFGEVGKRAAVRQYAAMPAKSNVRKLIDLLARLG